VLDTMLAVAAARSKIHAVMISGETVVADQVMLAIGADQHAASASRRRCCHETQRHIEVDRYSVPPPEHLRHRRCHGPPRADAVALHEAMCFARTLYGDGPARPITSLSPPRCSRGRDRHRGHVRGNGLAAAIRSTFTRRVSAP